MSFPTKTFSYSILNYIFKLLSLEVFVYLLSNNIFIVILLIILFCLLFGLRCSSTIGLSNIQITLKDYTKTKIIYIEDVTNVVIKYRGGHWTNCTIYYVQDEKKKSLSIAASDLTREDDFVKYLTSICMSANIPLQNNYKSHKIVHKDVCKKEETQTKEMILGG